MIWIKNNRQIPIQLFEPAAANQHGVRYRYHETVKLNVGKIAVEVTKANTSDYEKLILISNLLNAPLTFNFEMPQTVSIEIVSAAEIFEKILRR